MLSKQYRLTKRGSFDFLYKKGLRTHSKQLTLLCFLGRNTKIGFVVSNKIGKAVVRNLIKRRLRAIVREYLKDLKKTAQIVFLAKEGIELLDFMQLKSAVGYLLKKSSFI